jgi:hypothetical protein
MKTRSGPIMSVPYPIEINNSPQILVRHHSSEEFRDFIIGQFGELLRQSAKQPLVCGIALTMSEREVISRGVTAHQSMRPHVLKAYQNHRNRHQRHPNPA